MLGTLNLIASIPGPSVLTVFRINKGAAHYEEKRIWESRDRLALLEK